ncbi:DEAD/DEAH box helicase [Pelagicoccus sp. SDUM812002]|uniref:DEAD/DEAH box helicase n=1 Tax=Pelagicoccus sp. SDUM812002 TaxID=3041266 RepID=UPI00280DC8B3|nr:DEAD/DEAH box helicase [Pelagicoccus sp. SDUM812002]MDQ8187519.1 DEAD/DEAH box helicase [Pelagicoccus sp. SDUM812002]
MSEQEIEQKNSVRFADLSLSQPVQDALVEIGYETPSPIQAKAIPVVLSGRDLIGQAQTGTGKTAAFALPLLSMLDPQDEGPKAIILAPTRELALQVSEAISNYGRNVKKLGVTAIYGGTDFTRQFRALERKPAIVVGTPGRIMDHIRRGSLDLSRISHVILDEADEMLRMGFIEDVEWILEHTPADRQTALFSATMPPRIAAIAKKQLKDPVTVAIKTSTATVSTVRQRFIKCNGMRHKIEVLGNLLETEERDAAIVFTRTKSAASEIADELAGSGHSVEAIHGDISQAKRERAVSMLKEGKIDILVATDVAARGLDVDRISHVFNFDIPDDAEPYIHRIGRAGRAGRSGEAILLLTKRDFRKLRNIEDTTRQQMQPMPPPSRELIAQIRQTKLEKQIGEIITEGKISRELTSVTDALAGLETDAETLAAALLKMLQAGKALPSSSSSAASFDREPRRESRDFRESRGPRGDRDFDRDRGPRRERPSRDRDFESPRSRPERAERSERRAEAPPPEGDIERYRVEVGHNHQVKPGNIVGAIANEAGLEAKFIGRIEIYDDHSTVDLPKGMPKEVLKMLKKAWVSGQQLQMSRVVEKRRNHFE